MTTLTATYCAFCEALRTFVNKFARAMEATGTARAAAELSRMGYHAEAKECMMRLKEMNTEQGV